ncbi:hypothetical protein EDM00_11580 [Ornithobacterium rhinotracheale]|nr:hypothetical protein [Ornithobacterium rhinotracheale]
MDFNHCSYFICNIFDDPDKLIVRMQTKYLHSFCEVMHIGIQSFDKSQPNLYYLSLQAHNEYELHMKLNALLSFAGYHQMALTVMPKKHFDDSIKDFS